MRASMTCLFLALLGATAPATAQTLDLVIRGGRIVDGTGAPAYAGDIGIRNGRIVMVGDLGGAGGRDTIDATGLVVAPGFVDVHSHTPPAVANTERRFNEGVIRQGVTTVVGGPDGGFGPWHIRQLADAYGRNGVGTNVAVYVGHNAIRDSVMGDGPERQRPANPDELAQMRAMVREGMEFGALGLSTGLMYDPGMFSDTEEVIALAREVAPYGGIYDSHVRNPVHAFLESDREVVRIAEEAGIPGKIGHLKAVGLHNEGVIHDIIDLVNNARTRGVEIVSDQYPYDGAATSTLRGILVVPEDLRAPDFDLRQALRDPETRARLAVTSENGIDGGFAWLKATGYTSMRITNSEDYPELVGRYLSELADERGVSGFDLVADLIVGAAEPVHITLGAIKEQDVRDLMRQPWNMIASDGGYADGSDDPRGHPRGAGTFPRVLGHYVREEGVLSLEEAVRKISSLPADAVRLEGRGRLAPGYAADIAVFDPETILDRSTWTHPNRFAEGVHHVVVNGVVTLRDGEMTGETGGQMLRRRVAVP